MATKAYILIKVKAGKTKSVLQSLKSISGVEQANPCFGQPDIFVFMPSMVSRKPTHILSLKPSGGAPSRDRRFSAPIDSRLRRFPRRAGHQVRKLEPDCLPGPFVRMS